MSTPDQKTVSSQVYAVGWRDAMEAAARLRTDRYGRRFVKRFSTARVIEHFVVLLAFFMLGITGFTQTFYNSVLGSASLTLFGSIEAVREVHHVFAFILATAAIYHLGTYLNDAFVYRRKGKLWFTKQDWRLLFHLGNSSQPVRFDRYTFAEKMSYWVIALTILALGLTGIVQGFPILIARIFPGTAIPLAQIIHRWGAALCVAAALIWHLYDVMLRRWNMSIFTGNLSIQVMEQDHPLELAYLEKAASLVGNAEWPVQIEVAESQPGAERTPAAREPVKGTQDAAPSNPVKEEGK